MAVRIRVWVRLKVQVRVREWVTSVFRYLCQPNARVLIFDEDARHEAPHMCLWTLFAALPAGTTARVDPLHMNRTQNEP